MKYLLDTDILSNLFKRAPSPRLLVRLAEVPAAQQCTSAVTFGELVYGAARLGAHGSPLLERIERLLPLNVPVLPFDDAAARQYGALRADLERAGTPLAEADLRIAAIALARDLILVTNNERHFRRVAGLPIENWL